MNCLNCGKELPPPAPGGHRVRRYCDQKCKQAHYRRRNNPSQGPQHAATAALVELDALRVKTKEQQQLIDEQASDILRLGLKADIERRFLEDQEKRTFPAWLKRYKGESPLREKIAADVLFPPRDSRMHYEYRLRHLLHCSDEEIREFARLWKLMIF